VKNIPPTRPEADLLGVGGLRENQSKGGDMVEYEGSQTKED
jgi:hypothetical protein